MASLPRSDSLPREREVRRLKEQESPATSPSIQGNPAERMLESCATVEEVIAFFETQLLLRENSDRRPHRCVGRDPSPR